MMRNAWIAATVVLVTAAGCGHRDRRDGEQAVRVYLDKVIEAYRVSDEGIVDPYVGDEHALRLVGLIGVKRDAGLTLDARLLEISFERVERAGDRLSVFTRERWHYADRKIGTGAQVGQDSMDSYHNRYDLIRKGDRWVVEQITFVDPPVVGRKEAPMATDFRDMHGLPPKEEAPAGKGDVKASPPAPGKP